MEKIHKRALQKCQPQLVKEMIGNDLLNELTATELLTERMIENIKAGEDRSEQNERLLYFLPRREKEAYDTFIACLKKSKQGHLANVIVEQEQQLRRDGEDQYAIEGNGKPGYPQTDDSRKKKK